jgi:DNA-binding SARP family transcriptional activator
VLEPGQMLDFRILGPLEVERDGASVTPAGKRPRAALVLLLLEANRVVPSERLIDALWGERPPLTAATALRNVVSQLRKQLGPETIETRPPGYLLRRSDDSLDLARFERRLTAAAHGPVEERVRLLREALAEWRGPPLQELAYESFLQGEIRRLEDLHVAAQEDLLEAELELGLHAELVSRLETLIARHPHRERPRAQLMLALYRSGRQAEALQVFQDARRVLAGDLGLEPGPALRQLHGAILRQEPGLEPGAPANGGPRGDHLTEVVDALFAGRLVAVLASTADLAPQLAARFRYPPGDAVETPRVSQYAATLRGYGPLHDELRALAEARAEPAPLHRFFAWLPPLLRARGLPHQLLVTADYDGALEQAFAEAGEEVDVVAYLAGGPHRGKFCHLSPGGSAQVIEVPGDYATELSLERRTVILRVRGRADPAPARDWESFVVTEDDHLDYLRRADVASRVPVSLAATLRRSHFLFLGYAVRDWCLRLVLGRICAETPLAYRSWAVAPEPGPTEAELWRQVGVELVKGALEPYVAALQTTIASGDELPA